MRHGVIIMNQEGKNKNIVRRFYKELYNRKNIGVIDELLSEDYIRHSVFRMAKGRRGFKNFFVEFYTTSPKITHSVKCILAEKDKVVVRFTLSFINKKEFMGIPPTGKKLEMTGIAIFRIANGRIVEYWDEIDRLGLMRQAGMIP